MTLRPLALALVLAFAAPALAKAGCAEELKSFRAVLEQDLRMGHVAKRVHDAAQKDLAGADKACSAGQDAAAVAQVQAVKKKHGYRP